MRVGVCGGGGCRLFRVGSVIVGRGFILVVDFCWVLGFGLGFVGFGVWLYNCFCFRGVYGFGG